MEVVVHSCAAAHKSVYCVETRKFFVASHCSCSLVITFLRYSISSSNCVRTARSRCSLILSGEAVFNFASYAMRSMHRCAQFARNSCSAPLSLWCAAPLVSRAGLARRWSRAPLVSRALVSHAAGLSRWSHAAGLTQEPQAQDQAEEEEHAEVTWLPRRRVGARQGQNKGGEQGHEM